MGVVMRSTVSVALAMALTACSANSTAPTAEGEGQAESGQAAPSQNLSEDKAIELVANSRSFLMDTDDSGRVSVPFRYGTHAEGIQWLVDNGLAEWDDERWNPIHGTVNQGSAGPTGIMLVPVLQQSVAIESITTEGARATIHWRYDYTPSEPFYTLICVQNASALVLPCRTNPARGTMHAIRSDDGVWRLEDG